ncbi:MAG: NADH-quinone oxidoreductase subunit L [Bacteriovoracales bacterium]|nr:NADH-quinone oxidoreductase subunit L [Bacteriovoracales bacterium]
MEYTIFTILPIFLLPFLAFVLGSFIVKRSEKLAMAISTVSIFVSFLFSAKIFSDFIFSQFSKDYYIHKYFNWFDLSSQGLEFSVDLGIYIDNMAAVMLLMVTGVATLIHVFSIWYMADDKKYGKFFVYLSLFTSAMIGLVLSDNLLSLFIFWEIMGFCSYSLIGFYHEKEKAGEASLKAFMTTRVGDVIFLLGIVAIWGVIGTVNYVDIYSAIANGVFEGKMVLGISLATFAGFCIFAGTVGKSAQFPLQVWLPDAMMGPTPCSALIHAATMVAAGVYLSLRMYPLMELGGITPFIACVGGLTAFGAATIALVQTDLKAVLAYSTISQLGYMVLGVGVGAYNAAFMHLITHAIFKACLFLSAGSVIHSLHDHQTHDHVQEMPRMGGLKTKLPLTFLAMMACTLAISGVPLFSGFVSKDRILGDALYMAMTNKVYWVAYLLGALGAGLTAFYMFRMMFLTFFGAPRDEDVYKHCHKESLKWNRNVPLLLLSIFTLGIFFSGSPSGQGIVKFGGEKYEWFKVLMVKPIPKNFTTYSKEKLSTQDNRDKILWPKSSYESHDYGLNEEDEHRLHTAHIISAIASVVIASIGILIAFLMYIRQSFSSERIISRAAKFYKILVNKYYMDHFYIKIVIRRGLLKFNRLLANFDLGIYDRYAIDGWEHISRYCYRIADFFDRYAVDKIGVDGFGFVIKDVLNKGLRFLLAGKVQFYFIVLFLVLAFYMFRISTA